MKEENKASPGAVAVRKTRVGKNTGTKKSRKRHRPKGPPWKTARTAISNAAGSVMDRIRSANKLKILSENVPYIIIFYIVEKQAWLYRYCTGDSMIQKLMNLFLYFGLAFRNPLPSVHPRDIAVGILGAAAFKAFVSYRMKNAKKFRQGVEYGSARWGTAKDIAPFVDPVFENNVILTQTEFLTMDSRPKNWKYARNKNIIVIGGSGSGKTRYFVKPNLMQAHKNSKISYVVTDPNVSIS